MRAFVLLLALLLSSVSAAPVVFSKRLPIGNQVLVVGFSEYPPRAERSIDLTFWLEPGKSGAMGSSDRLQLNLIRPDGQPFYSGLLPRYPRDRNIWGLDSIALPTQGTWKLSAVIIPRVTSTSYPKTQTWTFPVLERPAGPPNNLIYALSSLPLVAMFVLGLRAWLRVRPLRQPEASRW
jgi:hypothetical protein